MKASLTKNGLAVRVIAGTHNAIIGIDLQENKRQGCLGFSIQRTDTAPLVGKPATRWLPNMLTFPSNKNKPPFTTLDSPLQKFRWGDYTLTPRQTYRYKVVPRYGKPLKMNPIKPDDGVEVEVTTEDTNAHETAIFFNRAAAASKAFDERFPRLKDFNAHTPQATQARTWLSNGLEEAILAYLAQAKDKTFALHAAVYEFQKPELLQGLKDAIGRGVDVSVVVHHRRKGPKDTTWSKNDAAIKKAKFPKGVIKRREANPQDAIMHNKFVVLLKKVGKEYVPNAVWTGSTNWTEGGIYGQLNVGHAIYDESIAQSYEAYFQLLNADEAADTMKTKLAAVTPVSIVLSDEHRITPIFSPQSTDTMLHLYSGICDNAKCLLVSAPFALSPIILAALAKKKNDVLRFMLLDKEGSLGKGEEVHIIQGDPADSIAVATTLKSPLHDFQGRLLDNVKESFHHAGIHIHSKIIVVDPFGSDPIVVTGSANFSHNSTEINDSNSVVFRGHTAVADIYATEFMRMFEHYHFRAHEARSQKSTALGLKEDDSWSDDYYVKDSVPQRDRRMFAGTM